METVDYAEEFLVDGDFKTAETLSSACIDTNNPLLQQKAIYILVESLNGQALAFMQTEDYDKASELINQSIRITNERKVDRSIIEKTNLLAELIEEKSKPPIIISVTPVITDTPIPPPSLRVQVIRDPYRRGSRLAIDFKVTKDTLFFEGVSKSDTQVLNGAQQVDIRSFAQLGEDEPVCIIEALDNSGTVQPGLSQIRDAVRWLNENRKQSDELGMVIFGSRVEVIQSPHRGSVNELSVTAIGDTTALWDGVLEALQQTRKCQPDLRYVIVLSDGSDNQSAKAEPADIIDYAERNNISVCPIGVNSSNMNEAALSSIAVNCPYYPFGNWSSILARFQQIVGETRGFYRVEVDYNAIPKPSTLTLLLEDAWEVKVDVK